MCYVNVTQRRATSLDEPLDKYMSDNWGTTETGSVVRFAESCREDFGVGISEFSLGLVETVGVDTRERGVAMQ